MKHVICKQYGDYNKLLITTSEIKLPIKDEVLVKVIASSINSADYELLKGHPIIRLASPFRPSVKNPGSDLSGIIEKVGPNVKKFNVGDRVYADLSNWKFGCFSEYRTISENSLRLIPENMSYINASAIPSAAILAYQSFKNVDITNNSKVLINGAGGGMGSYALQIAKHYGAEVTAVDNSHKQAMLTKMGADHIYDYEKVDFSTDGKEYDFILDCMGTRSMKIIKSSLSKKGKYVIIGGKMKFLFSCFIASLRNKKHDKKVNVLMGKYNNQDDLTQIEKFIKNNQIKPIIDSEYNLSEIKDAFKHYEEGTFTGKIVIKM